MSNVLIDQLYSISFNYLEKELFENSTFYGEKLLYEADSEETRLLLAKSYIGIKYLFLKELFFRFYLLFNLHF